MPSVIDELVLELGLDPTKFAEGRQRLQDELGKARQAVESFGKNVEHQGKAISDVFGLMKRGAAGILGAFIGDEAASFIDHVANMDAHTMRLAHSVGMSTRELTIWGNMVRAVGGDASQAGQTFATLNDALMSFATGQALPSPQLTALGGMANVNLLSAFNNPVDAFMKLTQAALQQPTDQLRRQFLMQIPGMNESMMFLALSGRMEELHKHFETMVGDMDKAAAEADELQKKSADLHAALDNLARAGFPLLTWLINQLTAVIGQFTGEEGLKGGVRKLAGPEVDKGTVGGNIFDSVWGFLTGDSAAQNNLRTGFTGSRGDRNNNPGNIKGMVPGATGLDRGGFAIFPTWEAGSTAMAQLLLKSYQGLTLAQIQRKWVGNEDSGYLSSMMSSTGLKAGDVPDLSKGDMMMRLIRGMMRGEGTHVGGSQKASSVNIGSINVSSSRADPKAVADQIPEAVKRSSMLAGANVGLT